MTTRHNILGLAAALGAGAFLYGLAEARRYTVRHEALPILPSGAAPIKLLQVSDLHMGRHGWGKPEFVRSLVKLEPDMIAVTGDNLNDASGIPHVLEALSPFSGIPGVYILGSHDYYAPQFENPLKYLLEQGKSTAHSYHSKRFPTHLLEEGFQGNGWQALTNSSATLDVQGVTVGCVGVDDPHIGNDDYAAATAGGVPSADVLLGFTHAPYRRVLDAMAGDGVDLVLAGHTHGGQICLPGGVPIITNADCPKENAKGTSRWVNPQGAESWLHVSAGVGGASKMPIRLNCPPEVSLLTLVAD